MSNFFSNVLKTLGLNKVGLVIIGIAVILCVAMGLTTKFYIDEAASVKVKLSDLETQKTKLEQTVTQLTKDNQTLIADKAIDEKSILAVLEGKHIDKKDATDTQRKIDTEVAVIHKKYEDKKTSPVTGDVTAPLQQAVVTDEDDEVSHARLNGIWSFYCEKGNPQDTACAATSAAPSPDKPDTKAITTHSTTPSDLPVTDTVSEIDYVQLV